MLSKRSRRSRAGLLAAGAGVLCGALAAVPLAAGPAGAADPGQIRITEWMYDGAGGEWVELTNVGGEPVDLAGWAYDDDSADPEVGFDLSGFGEVAPGEAVVFTESDAGAFRADWDLCEGVKVLGGYTNNLGRADQINVFDAGGALVDRLTYGDQTIGGPRTTGRSAWVPAAALGQDDATQWVLSTVDDVEGSVASSGGAIGSPGRSTRATVEHEACETGPAPTIEVDAAIVVGAVGDPTNPGAVVTITPADGGPADDVVVTATSSNEAVLPDAAVAVAGGGATRQVSFAPTGRGTTQVTFTAEEPGGATSSRTITYAASAAAPSAAGRYLHGISDASAVLDVGDGHALVANDETNTLFLFDLGALSGGPVRTWTFSAAQLGTSDEVDVEAMARSGDSLIWVGSHGNNREGQVRTERRTLFETTITGSGASTEVAFVGRYTSLWQQILDWDAADGHGRGADALGLVAAAQPGVLPDAPDGFNVEGFEFAPDGTTGYLGMRAPTVLDGGIEKALIIPVTNVLDLSGGTGPATFGAPILVDLGGRSIRDIRRNDHGDYLISAGPSAVEASWKLYSWDGDPAHAPLPNIDLPDEDLLTGGTWESVASVPHPIAAGAEVVMVTDSGDTDLYGTGATKDLAPAFQKSYLQPFVLDDAPGPAEPPVIVPGRGSVAEGDVGTTVLSVPVTLTGPSSTEVTVEWHTVVPAIWPWAKATPEVDFTSASGTVRFAPGQTEAHVEISVIGDEVVEPDEMIPVQFHDAVGATIDASFFRLGAGTIRDDERIVATPGGAEVVEGDEETTTIQIPVTLSKPASHEVWVAWETFTSPAFPWAAADPTDDYVARSGIVVFQPGETTGFAEVEVVGDLVAETDEVLYLRFGPIWGATLDTSFFGVGLGIIVDDDA